MVVRVKDGDEELHDEELTKVRVHDCKSLGV